MTTASEFWVYFFGNGIQKRTDYTGRTILKSAYNQIGSAYGWVLEYILPLESGGSDTLDNIQIVSCEANVLRNGRLTYTIDGIRYQIQKDNSGQYAICKIGDKVISFWEREFGDAQEAEDFAGRKIIKRAYAQSNSRYGWNIDHIQPLSEGGKDNDENKQIVHINTNTQKADRITFSIDGVTYQVQKTTYDNEKCWANDYDYSNKKYCIVAI